MSLKCVHYFKDIHQSALRAMVCIALQLGMRDSVGDSGKDIIWVGWGERVKDGRTCHTWTATIYNYNSSGLSNFYCNNLHLL